VVALVATEAEQLVWSLPQNVTSPPGLRASL
jgi:hypothetical protein